MDDEDKAAAQAAEIEALKPTLLQREILVQVLQNHPALTVAEAVEHLEAAERW
jgi:hypothetical protein